MSRRLVLLMCAAITVFGACMGLGCAEDQANACDASLEGSDCGVGELKFRVVSLAELRCQRITSDGVWESTRIPDPLATDGCGNTWFELEAGHEVRFNHPLGRRPDVILIYVAPTPDGQGATLATGGLGRIIEATSQWITIDNPTEGSAFIRIVIW